MRSDAFFYFAVIIGVGVILLHIIVLILKLFI
jgi:hypothetical protein